MSVYACRCLVQREEIMYVTAENLQEAMEQLSRNQSIIGRGPVIEVQKSPFGVRR